jgi:hypothetical protein
LTVAQLVSLNLESRQIVITIDDEVFVQRFVNNIDTSKEPPWIMIRDGHGSLGIVFFLSPTCTITQLTGGEIHIQEDSCQATIYPE